MNSYLIISLASAGWQIVSFKTTAFRCKINKMDDIRLTIENGHATDQTDNDQVR